jgi:CubicO group peptidase (beta-lactamase class C family)
MNWLKQLGITLLLAACATPPLAQPTPTQSTQVAAYLDTLLKPLITNNQIPVVIVAVVQTGKSPTYRSYGYADVATRRAQYRSNALKRQYRQRNWFHDPFGRHNNG